MSLRVVVPPPSPEHPWLNPCCAMKPPQPGPVRQCHGERPLAHLRGLRDWLPHRPVTVQTSPWPLPRKPWDGTILCWRTPIPAGGLGLWQGAPDSASTARCPMWVWCAMRSAASPPLLPRHTASQHWPPGGRAWCRRRLFGHGRSLIQVLEKLEALGVGGDRLRVINGRLLAHPGLKDSGGAFSPSSLTI